MNGYQRVLAVLRGELPDRVPVCLHNFLPAAREAGIPLERYLTEPEAAAQAHLQAVETYGYDCILIDLDTTMLAEAMGAQRDCTPGEPGHIAAPAIASLDEAEKLRPVDPQRDGRIPVLLEAIRIMARSVGGQVAIRGNCDQCAFSLAGLLRGMENFMMDLLAEPDHPGLQRLLEVSYQSHLATHRAVKQAGADFTSLGDSPAGPDVVSPAIFQRFARPYQETAGARVGGRRNLHGDPHLRKHVGHPRSTRPVPGVRLRTGLQDRSRAGQGHGGPRARVVREYRPQRRAGPGDGRAGARRLAAADRDLETRRPVRAERRLRPARHDPAGQYPSPGRRRGGIRPLRHLRSGERTGTSCRPET